MRSALRAVYLAHATRDRVIWRKLHAVVEAERAGLQIDVDEVTAERDRAQSKQALVTQKVAALKLANQQLVAQNRAAAAECEVVRKWKSAYYRAVHADFALTCEVKARCLSARRALETTQALLGWLRDKLVRSAQRAPAVVDAFQLF
jgi:hypothetical protein